VPVPNIFFAECMQNTHEQLTLPCQDCWISCNTRSPRNADYVDVNVSGMLV